MMEEPIRRGRGRPRKNQLPNVDIPETQPEIQEEASVPEEEPVKLTPKKQEMQNYYDKVKEMVEKDFQLEINENPQAQCAICHRNRPHTDFFRSYSLNSIGTTLPTGERHLVICKRCAKKIFNYYYAQEGNDLQKAINHWCQTMDLYYSDDIFQAFIKLRNSRKGTEMEAKFDYVTDYITALGRAKMVDLTYWDSPYLQDTISKGTHIEYDVPDEYEEETKIEKEYPEEFDNWSKEDLENYDTILEIYKYDPFIDELIDDRRKLYQNLVGFSSEDIAEDTGKANACIDMCRSIQRLEKLNKLRATMERASKVDIKEIKMLSELQGKERDAIQKYQKEWGFNQRYSLNRNQGSGTLTGILKQMDENMFEDSLVNAYDIKTSNAMQMAAEASWKAIFGQLNISESEFSQIVKNQRETITVLRAELDKTKEELRLANIQIKKRDLETRLAQENEAGGFR